MEREEQFQNTVEKLPDKTTLTEWTVNSEYSVFETEAQSTDMIIQLPKELVGPVLPILVTVKTQPIQLPNKSNADRRQPET